MKATKIDGGGRREEEERVLGAAVAGLRYKTLQIVGVSCCGGRADQDYEGLSNVSTAIPTKKAQLPNL